MVKFLHFSDTHIPGYKNPIEFKSIREQDALKKFDFVINKAIEENVDFVLHSGDLFETSNVSNKIIIEVAKILNKLKKENIPFYAIKGNHDVMGISVPSFDILKACGLLIEPEPRFLNNRLEITSCSDAKIIGLSEPQRFSDERLRDYYVNTFSDLARFLPSILNDNDFNIFMVHLTLKRAIKYIPYNDIRAIDRSFLRIVPNINYYALAHEHCPVKRVYNENDVFYVIPGSTEKYFDEADIKDKKRIFIYDNGDLKEIEIPHREMILIKNDNIDEEKLNTIINELKNVSKDALILLRLKTKTEKTLMKIISETEKISKERNLFLSREVSLIREIIYNKEEIKKDKDSVDDIIKEFLEKIKDSNIRELMKNLLFSVDYKNTINKIFDDKDEWWY